MIIPLFSLMICPVFHLIGLHQSSHVVKKKKKKEAGSPLDKMAHHLGYFLLCTYRVPEHPMSLWGKLHRQHTRDGVVGGEGGVEEGPRWIRKWGCDWSAGGERMTPGSRESDWMGQRGRGKGGRGEQGDRDRQRGSSRWIAAQPATYLPRTDCMCDSACVHVRCHRGARLWMSISCCVEVDARSSNSLEGVGGTRDTDKWRVNTFALHTRTTFRAGATPTNHFSKPITNERDRRVSVNATDWGGTYSVFACVF